MKPARTFFLAVLVFVALPARAGGDSSDGHTHAPPEAVLTTAIAPRAQARSEDFEVVAVLEGRHLVLYVDRFASNAPVSQARVEVEGAGLQGAASETLPGTYVIDIATAMLPGRYPLMISIEAGETSDLLSATLDTSLPATVGHEAGGRAAPRVWIIVALLLLVVGAVLAVWRKKRSRGR
jgi:hypothetical protein